MNESQVLAAYDEQVRRHPQPGPPLADVHADAYLVRHVSRAGDWAAVTWSGLTSADADTVIRTELERVAGVPDWEWKHYSDDRPADLPDRLSAAGLVAGAAEALMVAELTELDLDPRPPAGVELVEVTDEAGVTELVGLHDAVFGGHHTALEQELLAALGRTPTPVVGVLARAGGTAVAAGRVELLHGTDFAGLWGGGTLPGWRRRGVFGALVRHRAAVAAAQGFRYLQVDALPTSRPILERLGFVQLAVTTPYTRG